MTVFIRPSNPFSFPFCLFFCVNLVLSFYRRLVVSLLSLLYSLFVLSLSRTGRGNRNSPLRGPTNLGSREGYPTGIYGVVPEEVSVNSDVILSVKTTQSLFFVES